MNTVSFWLCAVSNEAYKTCSEAECRMVKAKTDEVLSLGNSLLFKNDFAMQHFLRAGTWVLQTTFTSFCLSAVTHKSMDTFPVGLVVAAQQVG